MIDHSISFQL
ncbi:hypothetical protein RDI58_027346 [Solanum bulbocastanum]|uniref:Uncharacterized protein n=1 Tax=Solanum bulbocastanum TaxID=147425 RepID=A0AAN8SVB9_SOLBU